MIGTNDSRVSTQELVDWIAQEKCMLELVALTGLSYGDITRTVYYITCVSLHTGWRDVYQAWKECVIEGREFEPCKSFLTGLEDDPDDPAEVYHG